jgi:hypothetical protein
MQRGQKVELRAGKIALRVPPGILCCMTPGLIIMLIPELASNKILLFPWVLCALVVAVLFGCIRLLMKFDALQNVFPKSNAIDPDPVPTKPSGSDRPVGRDKRQDV